VTARGGMDPLAPQMITKWTVDGPVRVGHTACYADPGAPIVVREADTVLPGADGTGYIEGRCTACITKPVLARGDAGTILILEHEPGCPVMAGLLRETGGAR
jgi:hypothetical protein